MDYNTVLQVLTTASSPLRGSNQQAAESQLKAWEAEKGFHYMLQSVYINTQLSLQVRWLAVICLKNGIEKYWRPTRINAITKEEKLEIRKRIFDLLSESNNQLAIQNAHLVSRICRLDFPSEWPKLFEDLVSIIESCSNQLDNPISIVKLNNLMIMLNQILKILATVRIGKARIMMQTKAPIILPHLIKFYNLFFNKWINDNNNINSNANFDPTIMEVGYMLLKNIRRLIVDGYVYQNRDKQVQEFIELSLQQFQKLLILHETNKLDFLERYIKCFVKLYFNLVRENTCSFILLNCSKNILLTLLSLLQQKAELIYNLEIEANDSDFWEKIAIKSFTIMKIITNYTFKETNTNIVKQKNDKLEIQQSIELLKSNFFTLELIENLINLITNYYLKLRPADLESWTNDPEDWFNEEMSVNWEFQIRKCAENYFQDLSIHFNEYISQFIMNKIENLNTSNLDAITRDSILCIFELSSNSIKSKCDFNQMLINYFIPQAINNNDLVNSKLIKRRVCLIINEWVDEKTDSEIRIKIYEFVSTLLSDSNNDAIIKLTAIQTLKYLIDDWEFRKRSFIPFTSNIIQQSLSLLNSSNTIECKTFILSFLSILIERNTPLIEDDVLIDIVKLIPILWENSNNPNEMIIKNSLLRILKDLVNALNKNSYKIHEIVIPLIPYCCDPKSDYYSLLCEDGLELWSSIMKTIDASTILSSKLLDSEMLELLINALITFTEILPLILSIIRSYYLISFEIFNNNIGLKIFEILSGYLKTMRDDSVFLTSSIIEIAIMQKDTNTNKEIFYSNLIRSKLFNEMIEYLIRDTDSPYCEIKISLPMLHMMIDRSDLILENIGNAYEFYILLTNLIKYAKNSFDPKIKKLFLIGLLSLYKNEYLQNPNIINTSNNEEIEYQLQTLNKPTGIASVLYTLIRSVVDLSIEFAEGIKEDSNGDLKVYHKQTSYDDQELKPYEPELDEPEDNEYALEMTSPVTTERERYTILLKTSDVVHNVVFKDVVKGIVGGVYGIVGNLLDNILVEELQRL
jgi:hypothetical protein